MRRVWLIIVLQALRPEMYAQTAAIHGKIEIQGVLTSSNEVPFWLRSDQFGSIPLPGASASAIGAIRKDYDDSKKKNMPDWGASVEVRSDIGRDSRVTLIEGYAKARLWIFEVKAGRIKEMVGLVDTSLSSGAFAISGNALGIPQVRVSIPEYTTLPFLDNLLAFKADFSVGVIGKTGRQIQGARQADTYYHHASLYGKLGKPDWRLKLDGGINHQVMWGSERQIFGRGFQLSDLKSFEYAVTGLTYEGSKVGNHLGSLDLGVEYTFQKFRLLVYRQQFYDEGALWQLANARDGLNGVSVTNLQDSRGKVKWKKLLIEVFYSRDQAGYPWSKPTASGDENYYNNYEYTQGWSYKGIGLGNPFITPYNTTRTGLPKMPADYFNNNRVVAFYGGVEAVIYGWQIKSKLSYSMNYGTFGTSQWGNSTGNRRFPPNYGLFPEKKQFSAYAEAAKVLNNGFELGFTSAFDQGSLFYNSLGFIAKLTKTF